MDNQFILKLIMQYLLQIQYKCLVLFQQLYLLEPTQKSMEFWLKFF
jgi:hypothetical protein